MRPPLSIKFVEKAEAALIAAVEVFNKPSFRYREETFALLAINAWELLLKAQLLRGAGNDPKIIRMYEPRKTKAGRPSKKQYLKRNRVGAPLTLSLTACMNALEKDPSTRVQSEIRANLDALMAIRDEAAHYVNASPLLARQVLEVGTATIKNFVVAAKAWFGRDFSESLSLVLPLAFVAERRHVDSVVVTPGENRLMKYLEGLASAEPIADSPYAIAIKVHIRFERSRLATASKVQITKDPDAVKVVLSEEDVRQRYPWDYRELGKRCAQRYADFKMDGKFHGLRKPLSSNPRYMHSRFLDPGNPKSGRKDFYSSAILEVFDREYKQK
ncbi:MAG TPA: DUF3644 domain-containing protein [Usitatibacter sp.]|nr:DUF3644 domain-containing protein [Usitatibacter sp.]